MTSADDLVDLELMLNRFNRVMGELGRGLVARNTFQPWEIDILLDIESCEIGPRRRAEILRQYQKAVARQLENGPGPPMKLSQFLVQQVMSTRRPSNV